MPVRPDPLLRTVETPLSEVFHPLGFPLEVSTNDERILACARASFGIFQPLPPEARPLKLRLLRDPDGWGRPPWPKPAYRGWRHLFSVVCTADNFVTLDVERGEGLGLFSSAMLDDAEFLRWTFLECAAYVWISRHFMTPIHASCVSRHGKAICLSGPPGAGKSSLAYAAVRSGYSLVADDSTWVSRGTPAEIRGNGTCLRFPESARLLFADLVRAETRNRWDGQPTIEVRMEGRLSSQVMLRAELGVVAFLNRTGGGSAAIERVTTGEAFDLLFSPLPVTEDDVVMRDHEAAIRQLVKQGAYRLHYSTLQDGLDLLAELPVSEGET